MKNIFSNDMWTENGMKLFIGKTLRFGIIVSCIIALFGGAIYLFHSQSVVPDYSPEYFTGTSPYLREFSSLIPHIMEMDGAAIIQLGVIALIATPVVRIVFSAIAFLIEKDYLYAAITLLVLAIITVNMALGLH